MARIKPIDSKLIANFREQTTSQMILEWKPLLNYGVTPPVALVVEYSVFFTQDLDANLESSCLMNEEVYQTNDYHRLTTKDLTKTIGLKQG